MLKEVFADKPRMLKYFETFGGISEPDEERQSNLIQKLTDFRVKHSSLMVDKKRRWEEKNYDLTLAKFQHYYYFMVFLRDQLVIADQELLKFEEDQMNSLLEVIDNITKEIMDDARLFINVPVLTGNILKLIVSKPKYVEIKNRHKLINNKFRAITSKLVPFNFPKILSSELLLTARLFDTETCYSPPGNVDAVLIDYIESTPKLLELIEPTAKAISESASVDDAIETISNTALEVYKHLEIGEGMTRQMIFISLTRYLFDEAYMYDKMLSTHDPINMTFLQKCEEYSKQKVKDLNLSKDVMEGYTPGLVVPTIFKGKRLNSMKPMEFMTNPIDMMNYVHTVLGQLGTYFGKGKTMSFDDTFTLLMAHMSVAPPVNAVSIAKFAIKWDQLQLSPIVAMAKNYYVAAVESMMGSNEWENDI